MFKALKNPTGADKRALAVFFGIALSCAIYFASGILVSYVSPPADYIELAADGKGTVVEISNIPTYDVAIQISNSLKEQRRLESTIDFSPTGFGYVLRIGPVSQRVMADRLASDLRNNGYDQVALREVCPDGLDCGSPSAETGSRSGVQIPPANPVGPVGPVGSVQPDNSYNNSGNTPGEKRP